MTKQKVAFDPTKPCGAVCGQPENFPSAAFEQNGCLFDRNHKHLNTDVSPPVELTDEQEANAELVVKLQADLQRVTDKLQLLGPKVEEGTATGTEKGQHTKAVKRHTEIVEELASLES